LSKKHHPEEANAAKEPMETADLPETEVAEELDNGEAAPEQQEKKTYTLTEEEFETAKKHIETLQKEKDDTIALLQRNQADFDNFRRRNANIRADSYEEGKRDTIQMLLPVLDNFDRAMDNAGGGDEAWREGVKLVHKQLMDILSKQGLTQIEAEGKFDPNIHEAVLSEKAEGKESGEILMVLQKGYRVGERIIRHCMVKVAE
jgi:molecular chaperone GrpE